MALHLPLAAISPRELCCNLNVLYGVVNRVTTGQTIVDYWGKTEYKTDDNWKQAIKLVEAVAEEF